jgi:anti-anti-sigma factor
MEGYQKGAALVVPVDADDCASLWKSIEPWLDRGTTRVVLDFAGVTFMNSVNIAQVIAVRQRAAGHQSQVQVANLRENIKAVFRILKLDRLFDLNLDLDAATA